jgi:hypothetical protein
MPLATARLSAFAARFGARQSLQVDNRGERGGEIIE